MLRYFLPSTVTVKRHTPRETLRSQLLVNGAAKVVSQVWAGCIGQLVDSKITRLRQCWNNAAQREALLAVGAQRCVKGVRRDRRL